MRLRLELLTKSTIAGFVFVGLGLSNISCTPASAPKPVSVSGSETQIFSRSNIGRMGLARTKKVALTFDDGPSADATLSVLDYLRKQQIKATFFIVGSRIAGNENVMSQMAADGHVIGSHTHTHCNLRRVVDPILSRGENLKYRPVPTAITNEYVNQLVSQAISQVREAHRAIAPYHNPNHRWYFRAPFGSWDGRYADHLNQDPELSKYIGPIFWNAGGELVLDAQNRVLKAADWNCWGRGIRPEECAQGYLNEITEQDGGVVLMHDYGTTTAPTRTPEMLRHLIPALKARGYTFVTLDEVRALDAFQ